VGVSRYRNLLTEVEAVRWYANGDHPEDGPRNREGQVVRYFRDPFTLGERDCTHCGVRMHLHGWIDVAETGHIVCPGDWVVKAEGGEPHPVKDAVFRISYTRMEEKSCVVS
jgi:hypothetical protein